jgi:hypothetical protein
MAASSGFQYSPGHAALGNAAFIASSKYPLTEVHSFVAAAFLLGVIIAKGHAMVHLN